MTRHLLHASFAAIRPGLLWLLLASQSAACTSWHAQPLTPEAIERAAGHGRLRVTLQDGSAFELFQAAIVLDSLVGITDPAAVDPDPGRRVAIPLAAVRGVAGRRFDGLKTTGLVVGSLLMLTALTCGDGCFSFSPGNVRY